MVLILLLKILQKFLVLTKHNVDDNEGTYNGAGP